MFVLNLVETVGILVGVTIAIMEIRRNREERWNQVADQIFQIDATSEFVGHWISFVNNMDFSTYEEWSEKYGHYANPEAAKHWLSLIRYYELLGQRVISGSLDLDLVLSNVDFLAIIALWEKSLPIVSEWRKRYNLPSYMNGFELLYNETKKTYPDFSFVPNPQRQRLMRR